MGRRISSGPLQELLILRPVFRYENTEVTSFVVILNFRQRFNYLAELKGHLTISIDSIYLLSNDFYCHEVLLFQNKIVYVILC